MQAPNGEALRITHRYSADIGAVLAKAKGNGASYTLKGDEIYVRAKSISSKVKTNPSAKDEVETAWTQPLVTGGAVRIRATAARRTGKSPAHFDCSRTYG